MPLLPQQLPIRNRDDCPFVRATHLTRFFGHGYMAFNGFNCRNLNHILSQECPTILYTPTINFRIICSRRYRESWLDLRNWELITQQHRTRPHFGARFFPQRRHRHWGQIRKHNVVFSKIQAVIIATHKVRRTLCETCAQHTHQPWQRCNFYTKKMTIWPTLRQIQNQTA